MAIDRDEVIGRPTGATTIHVERGPVENFATAVTDENPVFHGLEAAQAAGFGSIPAPPTFTFAAANWGSFPEDQPPDPTGGSNPMAEIMIGLMSEGGMVLGMFESVPFAQGSVEMRPGDTLVVYSDGVTETFDADGNEFAEGRLADVARRGRSLGAEALEGEILRDLELFSRGAKATDDRTLIVLKRT